MKPLFVAALLLAAGAQPVLAESCEEKFVRLLVDGNPDFGPMRIHTFSEIKGVYKSESYNYSRGDGSIDSMTTVVTPENSPWSLFLGKKMWMSTDKGESWTFVRELDAQSDPKAVKEALRKDAGTAANVSCGAEEVEGVMHDTVEGDYNSSGLQGAVAHQKYWVNPDSGLIAKTFIATNANGTQSEFVEYIEKWPDLVLPNPE